MRKNIKKNIRKREREEFEKWSTRKAIIIKVINEDFPTVRLS